MKKFNQNNKKGKRVILPSQIEMENKETLGVIVERLENLLIKTEEYHKENKDDHCGIIERQDHTNGNVSELQKRTEYNRGRLNMFAVITSIILLPFFIFVLKDYFAKRDDILIQKQKYEEVINRIESVSNNLDEKISKAIDDNNKLQFEEYNK